MTSTSAPCLGENVFSPGAVGGSKTCELVCQEEYHITHTSGSLECEVVADEEQSKVTVISFTFQQKVV